MGSAVTATAEMMGRTWKTIGNVPVPKRVPIPAPSDTISTASASSVATRKRAEAIGLLVLIGVQPLDLRAIGVAHRRRHDMIAALVVEDACNYQPCRMRADRVQVEKVRSGETPSFGALNH